MSLTPGSSAILLGLALIAVIPLRALSAQSTEGRHRLDEMVVTATMTEHPIEDAPVPTQVIRREDIEATSSTNVQEVLDQVPDIYVRRNDQFRLGASTVRMQGADPNKVLILLNGTRFRGGIDGVVDLRNIPVNNVERIEIIRGPSSSLYGSDAMAGVINIITRGGTEQPTFSATRAGGNFGRVLLTGSHGYRVGPVSYFLSASHDEFEIAKQFGDISGQFSGPSSDAKQVHDDLFGTVTVEPTASQRLTLMADFAPIREGPQSEKRNLTTGADWSWAADDLSTLGLGFNRYGFTRENRLQGFEEDVDYANWAADTRMSRTFLSGPLGEHHLLSLGGNGRGQTLRSAGTSRTTPSGIRFVTPDVDESLVQISPFLQDEILFGDAWSLVAGSSFDMIQGYGINVSPRLSVSWRPTEDYRLAAVVGRGFRAPDLLQLYDIDANNIVVSGERITGYAILGNPDLAPETDLGENLQFEAHPLPGLSFFANAYRHDFRDLIEVSVACATSTMCVPGFVNPFPQLSGQIFRYQNVGRAVTQGFDISFSVQPLTMLGRTETPHRLRLDLAYGHLYSKNESGRPGEDGKELPFRPPNRFLPSLTYGHADLGSEVKLWAEYEDRTFTDLTNSADFIARSHWLFNLRVAQTLTPLLRLAGIGPAAPSAFDGASVFVEGNNVFDEEFGLNTPMGRIAGQASFLVGVTYQM
jgi:outer membrane receptor for ferrienterochelin and colicins